VVDIILGILGIAAFFASVFMEKSVKGGTVYGSFYGMTLIFVLLVRLPRAVTGLLLLLKRMEVKRS